MCTFVTIYSLNVLSVASILRYSHSIVIFLFIFRFSFYRLHEPRMESLGVCRPGRNRGLEGRLEENADGEWISFLWGWRERTFSYEQLVVCVRPDYKKTLSIPTVHPSRSPLTTVMPSRANLFFEKPSTNPTVMSTSYPSYVRNNRNPNWKKKKQQV